jgi:acetyltransferase-like isoleucine patch superfamily enzyme
MKNIVSFLISITPLNVVRIFLYNILLGYKIDYKSKVGCFNIINSKSVKISNAIIGRFNYIKSDYIEMEASSNINKFNRVKNLHTLKLGERSRIFDRNFIGGSPNGIGVEGFDFKEQKVILGKDTAVNRGNFFDVVRSITIGDNVVFGGFGAEIWTHGFETDRTMLVGAVEFGNDIFIGSKCVFTKSVKVVDGVTIGPASVIYKSISEKGVYSTHNIYKVK